MEVRTLKPLVEKYLRERREGAVEAQLAKVTTQLDAIYWGEVEDLATVAAREGADRLAFDQEARFKIDLGLLDWGLLEGGRANRPELLRELYAPGPHLYFSEWLARRYREFILMSRIGGDVKGQTRIVRAAQARLYTTLTPLFRNLPGFPPQAVELFLSCRLDETIGGLARQLAQKEDERPAEQLKQLRAIRAQIIARARERASTDEELALFDALAKLDRMGPEKGPAPQIRQVEARERMEFVRGEIKLVRSLLRLGVTGSGLTKTHSVLVSLEQRLAKAALAPMEAAVREADAGLPGAPSIAIAPYIGTGFYEWDRDTIFVPLRSTRSAEDSVVTALANFRFMLDALQDAGALKKAYVARFREGDFRESFIRDYKAWVLGVAKGFKGALSPEAYAFFRERIGPRSEHLFASKELWALTPEERLRTIQDCRGRINRAEASCEDRYRLAVAYFRENRRTEAMEQLTEALRLNPIDGRLLFARGWLAGQFGAKAQAELEEVQELCPGTIWAVYAADELGRR